MGEGRIGVMNYFCKILNGKCIGTSKNEGTPQASLVEKLRAVIMICRSNHCTQDVQGCVRKFHCLRRQPAPP